MTATADHEARGMAQAAQATAERATDLLEQHVKSCGERAGETLKILDDFRNESREARTAQRESMTRLHTRVDAINTAPPAPAPAPVANGSVEKLESRLWRALGLVLLAVVGYLITKGPPWQTMVVGV